MKESRHAVIPSGTVVGEALLIFSSKPDEDLVHDLAKGLLYKWLSRVQGYNPNLL